MNNVRRSFWAYGSYLLFAALALVRIFLSGSGFSYLWCFVLIGSVVILVRLIVRPNYFEVHDKKLTIVRDFFYQDTVEIDDIDEIKLEEGPFSKSYIRLKDHKFGTYFNYFIINDKDFNKLVESLNLRVS